MPGLNKTILWALDYEKNDGKLETANRATGAFVSELKKLVFKIAPVHVLSLNKLQDEIRTGDAITWRKFVLESRRHLAAYLKRLDLGPFGNPHIVENQAFGMRSEIEALNRFAKKVKPAAIVVSTHARKGVKRFFLGSFAETLLQNSRYAPVITINPSTRLEHKFQNVLFPTDLSVADRKHLNEVIDWSRALKSELFLFHNQYPFVLPQFHSSAELRLDPYAHYHELMAKQKVRVHQRILDWGDYVRSLGLESRNVLNSSNRGLSDLICSFAKKNNCGLIFINSKTSRFDANFIGTLSREMVRKSEIPVMISR